MFCRSLLNFMTVTATLTAIIHASRNHHHHHQQQSSSSSATEWEVGGGVGPDGLWEGPECQADVPDETLIKRLYLPQSVKDLMAVSEDLEAAIPASGAECPQWSPALLRSTELRHRSLSPWTYSINEDPDRIPSRLPQARCLCPGCVDPTRRRHDLGWASVAVTAATRVLRRVACAGSGRVAFLPAWEHVAVACTCVAPNTRTGAAGGGGHARRER